MSNRVWYPDAIVRDLILGPPSRILTEEDFDPHQWEMSNLVQKKKAVILGAEMGLGKTGATMHGAIQLLRKKVVNKWLIIAPLRVAQETWPDAFHEWDFGREHRYSCILGDVEDRKKAVEDDAPFHIINREMVKWLWVTYRKNWPYDGLIYDEASRLKAGKRRSARVKNKKTGKVSGGRLNEFGSLAQARENGCFKRVVELTGTPAPNGLVDLWGIMYLIDLGYRLGSDREAFLSRWFKRDKYSYTDTPFDHSEKEILSLISDALYIFREEDHIDLMPLKEHPIWVTLDDKSKAIYKELQEEYVLEDYDVEAVNNGVLTNKLLQIANGFVYDAEKDAHPFHTKKLDALDDILTKHKGLPVMVIYSFIPDKDAILKKYPQARVFGETDDDMKDWNAGKIPILLIHPASAGHGLNFQFASNVMVWYGLNWSLELYLQAIKRLHRRGQQHDVVHMYLILAKDTYDVRQYESLSNKNATQSRIKQTLLDMRDVLLRKKK